MYIQQIETQKNSLPAFYIESQGYSALIDPCSEIEHYLRFLHDRKSRLIYVFETRSRGTFCGDHNTLAQATGAHVIYRPYTKRQVHEDVIARDGQEFKLGAAKIRLIHTPWITSERSSMRISNDNMNGMAVFTGDTLFLNYVTTQEDLTEDKLSNQHLELLRSA